MQSTYRDEMVAGRAGLLADAGFGDVVSLINNDPAAAQVDTLTVDTAVNAHDYTIEIDGVSITYTSDASATKPEISAGLKAAIEAEPLVSGRFNVVDDGVDQLTLTAVFSGVGWTLSTSDGNLSVANVTANGQADPVGFGLLVVGDASSDKYAKVAKAANLDEKAGTLTPTAANTTMYNVTITVGGQTYGASYLSDADATVAEICTGLAGAINTAMPASTVLASDDTTSIGLEAEVAGLDFSVAGFDSALLTLAWTTAGFGTDINRAARAVTLFDPAQEVQADGTCEYQANSCMSCARRGRVIVATEEAVSFGDDVVVRVAGTGTVGGFGKTVTAGEHIRLDPSVASWHKRLSSTLAVLEVNFR